MSAPETGARGLQLVHIALMNSRDVIRAIEADSWHRIAQKGDHAQFKDPWKKGRVTVPHPSRDIPVGTLKSIERQAGIKLR